MSISRTAWTWSYNARSLSGTRTLRMNKEHFNNQSRMPGISSGRFFQQRLAVSQRNSIPTMVCRGLCTGCGPVAAKPCPVLFRKSVRSPVAVPVDLAHHPGRDMYICIEYFSIWRFSGLHRGVSENTYINSKLFCARLYIIPISLG